MKEKKETELSFYIKERKEYLQQAFFITIFSAILPIAPIIYMRAVFGPVVNASSIELLAWLSFLLILFLALGGLLEFLRTRIFFGFITSLYRVLEPRIFETAFNNNAGQSNVIGGNKALQSLRQFKQFILSPVCGSIFDVPISLIFLALIFYIHPLMGLLSSLAAITVFAVSIYSEKKIRPYYEASMQSSMAARHDLADSFKDIQSAFSLGVTKNNFEKWNLLQKQFIIQQAYASDYQNKGATYTKILMLANGSLLLGVGTFLSLTGIMSMADMGMLIVAKFIGMLAVRPIVQAVMGWKLIIQFREAVRTIEDYLELNKPKRNSLTLPSPTGKLEVRNLSVKSNGDRLILDNINFKLDPPCLCAILGNSGSGKTTLSRLLVGIKEPTKGEVRLDGVSIHTWSKKDLSNDLGYLSQKTQLFEGTLAENIARYGIIDQIKLDEAVDLANLQDLKRNHEKGFDTKIDSDCLILSQGEKQRVGLARAFYGKPKYIVLDEPTSALDDYNISLLLDSIKKLKDYGSTIIVATHEKEILKKADFVLGLHQGRQKMFGSKEELMKKLIKK